MADDSLPIAPRLILSRVNNQLMNMDLNIQPNHPHNFVQLKCPLSTLICKEKTVIVGDVTIGQECVVHPTAHIVAKNGPIVIGNNNLIEERVTILNNRNEPMIIGDHNVFEVDSYCESPRVGHNNIMEAKSSIGPDTALSNGCIIGAGCCLNEKTTMQKSEYLRELPNNTVITGSNLARRVVDNLPSSSHASQLDFLRKILPNYQKLWRPPNYPSTPQQR